MHGDRPLYLDYGPLFALIVTLITAGVFARVLYMFLHLPADIRDGQVGWLAFAFALLVGAVSTLIYMLHRRHGRY